MTCGSLWSFLASPGTSEGTTCHGWTLSGLATCFLAQALGQNAGHVAYLSCQLGAHERSSSPPLLSTVTITTTLNARSLSVLPHASLSTRASSVTHFFDPQTQRVPGTSIQPLCSFGHCPPATHPTPARDVTCVPSLGAYRALAQPLIRRSTTPPFPFSARILLSPV